MLKYINNHPAIKTLKHYIKRIMIACFNARNSFDPNNYMGE